MQFQGLQDVLCKGWFARSFGNHSLRATAATLLYNNNFDEQVIQELTGHHSVAVREYKRTSIGQKRSTSSCVMGEVNGNVEGFDPSPKHVKLSQ